MNIKIAVDEAVRTENRVVTHDFKGSVDFKIDENGDLIGGEQTITVREMYEATKPAVIEEYDPNTQP